MKSCLNGLSSRLQPRTGITKCARELSIHSCRLSALGASSLCLGGKRRRSVVVPRKLAACYANFVSFSLAGPERRMGPEFIKTGRGRHKVHYHIYRVRLRDAAQEKVFFYGPKFKFQSLRCVLLFQVGRRERGACSQSCQRSAGGRPDRFRVALL